MTQLKGKKKKNENIKGLVKMIFDASFHYQRKRIFVQWQTLTMSKFYFYIFFILLFCSRSVLLFILLLFFSIEKAWKEGKTGKVNCVVFISHSKPFSLFIFPVTERVVFIEMSGNKPTWNILVFQNDFWSLNIIYKNQLFCFNFSCFFIISHGFHSIFSHVDLNEKWEWKRNNLCFVFHFYWICYLYQTKLKYVIPLKYVIHNINDIQNTFYFKCEKTSFWQKDVFSQ